MEVQGPPAFTTSDPIDYSPSKAFASAAKSAATDPPSLDKRSVLMKRNDDACSSQPTGAGPATTPDTDQAFLGNSAYDVC